MSFFYALQLYSVRDELEKDFYGTVKQVREMGYDGVELSGLNGADPLEVKRILDEVGLKVISSHVPVEEMLTPGSLARYKQAGCQYVAIPWMDHGAHNEKFAENIEQIRLLANMAREAGLTLLYHNHEFEFSTIEGKALLDVIYESIPADLLQPQVDTCWAKFAGTDPAAYLRKYAGRITLVHLKDFFCSDADISAPYSLIGKREDVSKNGGFQFRPIGYGIQDIPSILKASEESGAQWIIVEQDSSPDRPPMEAASMSIAYLRSL